MIDDIVNRLNCEAQNCILYNHGDAQLAIEASDEIERLRKERDLYRRLFIALYEGKEPTEEMRLAYVETVYPTP